MSQHTRPGFRFLPTKLFPAFPAPPWRAVQTDKLFACRSRLMVTFLLSLINMYEYHARKDSPDFTSSFVISEHKSAQGGIFNYTWEKKVHSPHADCLARHCGRVVGVPTKSGRVRQKRSTERSASCWMVLYRNSGPSVPRFSFNSMQKFLCSLVNHLLSPRISSK